MITNLLASIVITLVTNVTERVPTHWESRPNPNGFTNYTLAIAYGVYVPDPDPKTKWIKTTVKEVTQLKFTFEGEEQTITLREAIKSETEVEYELRRVESWESKSTNDATWIYPKGWTTFTNRLYQQK